MIKKKVLIIIPARAGSTGVPNKNIKVVNKNPLLYYTCNFAKKIASNENVLIGCTDSKKIKKIFIKYKVTVPFLRPKRISKNFSLDIEYVNYCLNFFEQKKIFFKYGVILRPTSPVRNIKDYKNAEKKFLRIKNATSLKSVCESPVTPFKMWMKKKNEIRPLLKTKFKEHYNMPRQKLPETFWQTGTYDFFKINYKKKIQSISGNKIVFYQLKNKNNIDVDNFSDYEKLKKVLK
jgi:CMP-N,N'-diacetyllegionaminic acid synthase